MILSLVGWVEAIADTQRSIHHEGQEACPEQSRMSLVVMINVVGAISRISIGYLTRKVLVSRHA